jgi:arylsulfatase
MNALESIELYNLKEDIGESKDVAAQYPEIVDKIKLLADEMRSKLGDKLFKIEGSENRPVGRID